jgi:hypothetical protein
LRYMARPPLALDRLALRDHGAQERSDEHVRLAGAADRKVRVQTRGPDAGNPTPKRKGRRSGAPGPRQWRSRRADPCWAREGGSDGTLGA